MKIEKLDITIADLVDGYADEGEKGVVGYGKKLDIRPPYQREFVYDEKQRNDVIESVLNGFPLNVMYWAVGNGDKYEVLDGQQRTISIGQYISGVFSVGDLYYTNQRGDVQDRINKYELAIYICDGAESEKLKWFEIINIAGEKLTDQERRNAVFSGPWVTDAKRYFSRNNCAAKNIGENYVKGSPIRQEFLETAIKWISGGAVEDYMGLHQSDKNAEELWSYFQSIIDWIEATFTTARPKFMRKVDWGKLYTEYRQCELDPESIEEKITQLILDDDVQNKSGIYTYLLDGDEQHLKIRAFSDNMKQKVYENQKHICLHCKKTFKINKMEGDHIVPWRDGGSTVEDNLQMLCKRCNQKKYSN